MTAGIVLVALAAGLCLSQLYTERVTAEDARLIAEKLYSLIPDIKTGDGELWQGENRAVLEIDGESFVGVLEIPAAGRVLPVSAESDSRQAKIVGTAESSGLVVFGKSHSGQFDFMKTVTETDPVFFTDVLGFRYAFEVCAITVTEDVSAAFEGDGTLVLYARDGHSSRYTVVSCRRTAALQ